MNRFRKITLALAALLCVGSATAAHRFVSFKAGDFLLNNSTTITLAIDEADQPGVAIAAANVARDIEKVCGTKVQLAAAGDNVRIVAGTLGSSAAIDRLAKRGAIDARQLRGKCEKFIITTDGDCLVIAGSDRRGTIYGLYELSRQIGVSPWYYWADVAIERHDSIFVSRGLYTDGEPAVRYRGIFLNDEAPCLTTWVKNSFGTDYGDHRFYEKVFELILRLKGNFMWPAMWGWAFYADDPENSKTAYEMGVIVGTSHHEPMARNHQEYARRRSYWGAWNYDTNKEGLDRFFREGIERARDNEDIITIGMRGDGDAPLGGEEGKDHEFVSHDERIMRQLTNVIEGQRRIIKEVTGRPAKERQQVWALYKEVQKYYDLGLQVPDDVMILLCDDNWGNVRRVPTQNELKRKGGWGLYYHVDYVGAPRNSKWLNVTPTQNMWEQLTLAYEHGIEKMWILNVGDIKPMEYPITLFMDMAWSPRRYSAATITDHTLDFCRQAFGDEEAPEAARILNLLCKLNGRSTAEMLDHTTYAIDEWSGVVGDYLQLENDALAQYLRLPRERHDSYKQLILFPAQAMSNLHQLYQAVAMNRKLFAERNSDCNEWARRAERAFRRDSLLMADYNENMSGGKWRGMMVQKHIGYTSWNDDFGPRDVMPAVSRLDEKEGGSKFGDTGRGYVVMEAAHYYAKRDGEEARWSEIPHMGRTHSAMTLLPYNRPVAGAALSYRFALAGQGTVKVHVVLKSTLDYLNQGGLQFELSLDGGTPVRVNFNERLNEAPENIYSVYYPTVARRVVESVVELPMGDAAEHTLTFSPLDAAIVLQKIVVDAGGYTPRFLFGEECGRTVE